MLYNPKETTMAKVLLGLLCSFVCLATPAFAVPVVVLGSDYFQTLPGSFADIPGFGIINFIGNPTGPGSTDTIQQRKADAIINGPPIEIQVVSLSLKSA